MRVDAKNPVARRIAAQAQPDLLVIERTLNDKGVLHKQIAVDDIRRTVAFFGSTAGEGGWRVAIVDAVDELNRSGANALLKVLEEPPQRALLLLVSHSAARVPATLRSRCRILTLRPLAEADVAARAGCGDRIRGGRSAISPPLRPPPKARWRARLAFLDEGALELRQQALDLLDRLPALDAKALHALGEALAGTDPAAARGLRRHRQCLAVAASRSASRTRSPGWSGSPRPGSASIAAARDAETYNLERKPLVFSVFGLLAEATRG